VLWLWVTSHPLPMAWQLAVTDDADAIAGFQALLRDLDDATLEALLVDTQPAREAEPILAFPHARVGATPR
jgi:hypothetical protein